MRRLLRDAALGELGTDISTAADETLIATGLEAGDAEIAVTASEAPLGALAERSPPPRTAAFSRPTAHPTEEEYMEPETRIMEPIPEEDEIRITATPWLDEVSLDHSTLDFPAIEDDIAHRERVDSPRVRHLFPVPEATGRSASSSTTTTAAAPAKRDRRRSPPSPLPVANR